MSPFLHMYCLCGFDETNEAINKSIVVSIPPIGSMHCCTCGTELFGTVVNSPFLLCELHGVKVHPKLTNFVAGSYILPFLERMGLILKITAMYLRTAIISEPLFYLAAM